jgi:hypothetical protein
MADSKKKTPRMTRSQQTRLADSDDQEETSTHDPTSIELPSSDLSSPIRGRSQSTGFSLAHSYLNSPAVRDTLARQDARQRFETMVKKYKELEAKFNELETRENAVSKELEESNMLREQAAEERDEAIAHLMIAKDKEKIAVDARNEMAYQLLQSGNHQRSAPIVEAVAITPRVQKTTKMPDAPMLSDGKEVRFETWQTVIRQKLLANADHYPNPIHRMIYVQSRCEGKAQLHIAPRMDPESATPYTDAEDILMHLKTVFANPNRKAEAYTQFHKLKMKPKENFTDFLASFMQLAEEACIPIENRKQDLYFMLPYLLQTQVMLQKNQSTVSFDEFVQICISLSYDINVQQKSRSGNRARIPSSGNNLTSSSAGSNSHGDHTRGNGI